MSNNKCISFLRKFSICLVLLISNFAFGQSVFWEAINKNQFSSIESGVIMDSIEAYYVTDITKAEELF